MSITGASTFSTYGQLTSFATTALTLSTAYQNFTGGAVAGLSNRTTLTTTGSKITFNGPKPETVVLSLNCTYTESGAETNTVAFYQNGTIITGATMNITSVATAGNQISMTYLVAANPGDYFQVYVKGGTGTFTITNACFQLLGTTQY